MPAPAIDPISLLTAATHCRDAGIDVSATALRQACATQAHTTATHLQVGRAGQAVQAAQVVVVEGEAGQRVRRELRQGGHVVVRHVEDLHRRQVVHAAQRGNVCSCARRAVSHSIHR